MGVDRTHHIAATVKIKNRFACLTAWRTHPLCSTPRHSDVLDLDVVCRLEGDFLHPFPHHLEGNLDAWRRGLLAQNFLEFHNFWSCHRHFLLFVSGSTLWRRKGNQQLPYPDSPPCSI